MSEGTRRAKTPNGRTFEVDGNDFISGEVKVELAEIVRNDLEAVLDMLSEYLTGSNLLQQHEYQATGVDEEGNLVLKVSGSIEMMLDSDEIEFEEPGASPGP